MTPSVAPPEHPPTRHAPGLVLVPFGTADIRMVPVHLMLNAGISS